MSSNDFSNLPFTASVRDLEIALAKERQYSKQLYEYAGRMAKAYQELQKTELNLRNQVASGRNRDSGVEQENRKLQRDLEEIRTELARYRRAWSDILLREREAESIIGESKRIRARLEELEAENRTLYQQQTTEQQRLEGERKRIEEHYRTELQAALLKLHETESRFNKIAQELQNLEAVNRKESKEAKGREDALRWEMQNKILEERENVRKSYEGSIKKAQDEFARESENIRVEFSRALIEEKRIAAEGMENALAPKNDQIRELQGQIEELIETRRLEAETMLKNQREAIEQAENRVRDANAERNSALDELGRNRALLSLKEDEIRRSREAAEKAQAETREAREDSVRRIALADAEAGRRVAEIEAQSERRLEDAEKTTAALLRQARDTAEVRYRKLEAKSEEDYRQSAEKIQALQAQLKVTEDQLEIERSNATATLLAEKQASASALKATEAAAEERYKHSLAVARQTAAEALAAEKERAAAALASEEGAHAETRRMAEDLRVELIRLREETGSAKKALEKKIETQEKDFQLLCDTLVQAQKARESAENAAEVEKDSAIEALANSESRAQRVTALTEECELLRKVLQAEKQKMRELVLQLKFELKARKAGVELSPQVIDAILGSAEIPELATKPVDS